MSVRRSGRLNKNLNSNQGSNVLKRSNPDVDGSTQEEKRQCKEEPNKEDCQQPQCLNGPQIQQPIQEVKKETQEKETEPVESMKDSDSQDKKVSETTKVLEATECEGPDKKRLKRAKIPVAVQRKKLNQRLSKLLTPKSALNLLHEFKPGCVYKVQSQAGCIPPSFSAQVEYDNVVLGTGQGLSKAQAKNAAAENAIKTIVSRTMAKATSNAGNEEGEKAVDDEDTPENLPWAGLASFAMYKMFSEWQSQGTDLLTVTRSVSKPKTKVTTVSSTSKKELPPNAAELHPAVVLNMMHQGLTAVELEREDGPNCRVKMGFSIDGQMFTGVGRNKKDARKEAAKAVLENLHGLVYPS